MQSKYYNLYERNLLTYFKNRGNGYILRKIRLGICKNWTHDVYIKYIEVPITTKCSLNCKECSNLIQYYQSPYQIDANEIMNDINKLTKCVKGIWILRILGGEPLLHSDLAIILKNVCENKKIKNVQIVTNGTKTFSDEVLKVLQENKKVTVDISNYEEKSVKKDILIEQLKKNNIVFHTQSERIQWTKQGDVSFRGRSREQLELVYSQCTMDCISLLSGKLHLCPRSSHGMDLGIVEDCKKDYVNVREKIDKEDLFRLLNTKSINACNYCDVYRWESLPQTIAAEQISKSEAKEILEKYCEK